MTHAAPCRLFMISMLIIAGSSCSPPPPADNPAVRESDAAPHDADLNEIFDQAMEALGQEDWAAADRACVAGIEAEPELPTLLIWAARAEAHLGDLEACRAHLETAVDLGGAADLAADDAFDAVLDQPGFPEIAERLLANAAPMPPAEIVHRFADAELWPEGIAADTETGDLYIGSIGRRAIFRLTPDGRVEELGTSSRDGLMEVLGMWVDAPRRALWAATGLGAYQEPFDEEPRRNELVRYDLETGRLVGRYPLPDDEHRLLNDVVVAPDGTAWATETLRGELFRVPPDGELELFRRYPDLVYLNGIALSDDGGTIYLGHYDGLSAIAPDDGAIERVRGERMALGMVDGLSWIDGGLVIVQNSRYVNNRVVRVDLDSGGRHATRLGILPCGLPAGLIPYTCAVDDDAVFVVAGALFGLRETGETPSPPAVVRLPLPR